MLHHQKVLLKDLRLLYPLLVLIVLQEELFDDLFAEFELIDAVLERLFRHGVACADHRLARDGELAHRLHRNDLLHPEDLILAKQVQSYGLATIRLDELLHSGVLGKATFVRPEKSITT